MQEPIPQWAQQLLTNFNELEQLLFDVPILRDKTITNYNEFKKSHKIIHVIQKNTNIIPQILEIVIENYRKYDELLHKVDKLVNCKTNCPYCIQHSLNVIS